MHRERQMGDAPRDATTLRDRFRLVPLAADASQEVQRILTEAADYFRSLGATAVPADLAERLLLAAAHVPGRHLMALTVGDEAIGLLDFRLRYPDPETASLGLILIVPSWRGRGFGTLALDIWETWLAYETPIRRVRVGVPAHLRRAFRFFLRRGYHPTGEARRVPVGDWQPRVLFLEKGLPEVQRAPEANNP